MLPEPYYQDELTTIYHGDSLFIAPFLGEFDLVLTDPPYGLGSMWQGGGWAAKNTYTGDCPEWDEKPISDHDIQSLIIRGEKAIVWGGNYYRLPPSRCWLIWNKIIRGFTLADAEMAWTNLDKPVRCFDAHRNKPGVKRWHPTQKPLELMHWCLNFVPEAKTVFDPFMGSGTTLLACKQKGVKCVGIELDKKYCDAAVERLSQTTLNLFA